VPNVVDINFSFGTLLELGKYMKIKRAKGPS
jgi:hypothetical protein